MARWHNCPSLAVFWCNGIFTIVYLYTIYVASTRYTHFKINSGNPKYGLNWNENYIVFYLVTILIASLLWLLFLYSSIFQTGHLANDYVELGKVSSVLEERIKSTKCLSVCGRIFKRIRYHFIPFNAMLHLFGAFSLLAPIPLLMEEEAKHGVNSNGKGPNKSIILCIYFPEIINFVLASFCLIVRLPTIYSSSSRSFGIIYSVVIFISTANIFIHCISNQLIIPHESNMNWRRTISNIGIFFISSINFCLIYEHGRRRFLDSIIIHRLERQNSENHQSSLLIPNVSSGDKYWPNVIALFLWIAIVALYIYQYCQNFAFNAIYLFDMCINIVHCLVWLIAWLLFTFKSDWEFSGSLPHMKDNAVERENSFHIPQRGLKPCDTIYTCFQTSDQIRSISSQSSKTPNHDISSTSSSTSSRISEKATFQTIFPSNSKQIEFAECNYEDPMLYKSASRRSKNTLKDISEENHNYQEMYRTTEISQNDLDFFKSPNVSQRSSNLQSSDSGIGITFRDNADHTFIIKPHDNDILKYRKFKPQTNLISKVYEYNIDEELLDPCENNNTNMCSDV